MMKRLIIAGVVLAFIAAACGDDTADTTTATDAAGVTTEATTLGTAAPPDTAMPADTVATTEPEGPFIREGDFSAFVAALQFFLDCNGYGPVTIDGMFGEATGTAVRLAQSDLGFPETGEPTEAMYVALAVACDQSRSIFFPPGSDTTQNAGYVEPGRHEDLGLYGEADQMLTIEVSGDDPVALTLLAADGATVQPATVGTLSVMLPSTEQYTLRVSASGPASYLLMIELTGAGGGAGAVDASGIVLDHEALGGLKLVDLGQPIDTVIEYMTAKLGPPAFDTGDDTETGCPGAHRQAGWAIPAPLGGVESALVLHFHDDEGRWPEMQLTDWGYWRVNAEGVALDAKALLSTSEGITLGSTTSEAIAAYPELEFGMNALSGAVMGWVGDFELIVFANFGDGPFDVTTDFSVLEGHVTGIRLPTNNCPDELSY